MKPNKHHGSKARKYHAAIYAPKQEPHRNLRLLDEMIEGWREPESDLIHQAIIRRFGWNSQNP